LTGLDGQAVGAVSVLGVPVSQLTVPLLLDQIDQIIHDNDRAQLLYANVYGLNLAYEQPWFRELYRQSRFVLCDGFGVKWGARLLGQSLPARLTPPDWLFGLAELCARRGYSIAFLGNQPGVGEQAAERLKGRCPELSTFSIYHGYFDKTPGSMENEQVIARINAARPNILMVGFGMPTQERWLAENWSRLKVNMGVAVGAMPDYIAGSVARGPRWMTDHGLEWLTRLVIEPRRLWRRYLLGNPLFLIRVLRQRLGLIRFS
jgi:N-acetylglucosaminyldiphosphoundecaprenol N-acetyl-beta-D-mannosaminyltransferase